MITSNVIKYNFIDDNNLFIAFKVTLCVSLLTAFIRTHIIQLQSSRILRMSLIAHRNNLFGTIALRVVLEI